jgi:ABC-type multidrug transport system ATPase subunit
MTGVGLGYLRLGQPLTTLSGGERQRLKLATHMGEEGGVYVLDEPTTGLHLADLEQLLGLLDRLVDSGKSVIVIEHHLSVMAHADWIIDLGPGAGHDGGRVVFEGTPADLVAAKKALTGKHLAEFVDGGAKADPSRNVAPSTISREQHGSKASRSKASWAELEATRARSACYLQDPVVALCRVSETRSPSQGTRLKWGPMKIRAQALGRTRLISEGAGVLASAIGVLVLIGWTTDVVLLKTGLTDKVTARGAASPNGSRF